MEKLLDEIESYWSTRTEGYSEVNHKELAGTQKNAWLKVLTSQFPDKPKEEIRILDIGTGPVSYTHLDVYKRQEEGDLAVIFPDVIHHYQVFSPGENKAVYLLSLIHI